MKVLVTGGAGFVGSFLVEALHREGCAVRVLDSFEPQVHGTAPRNLRNLMMASGDFVKGVEVRRGDVRDGGAVAAALEDVDVVVHLAAQVGVGQSMYEIVRYVDHNDMGTAVLLAAIGARKPALKKLIVASSMALYGEGAAACTACGDVHPPRRDPAQLRAREWEARCPRCRGATESRPTAETTPPSPTSIYGVTKRGQEELCLAVGHAYGVPVVALRFFNVYGPRQALANPYTGVTAIFASRILNRRSPVVFEDGGQTRDFVHVSDVVQAVLLAIARDEANFETFNVGTGRATSVLAMAQLLAEKMHAEVSIRVEGRYREGDIRHCHADIRKIRDRLGYAPRVALAEGVQDLITWAGDQNAEDHYERAALELALRGLSGVVKP